MNATEVQGICGMAMTGGAALLLFGLDVALLVWGAVLVVDFWLVRWQT